MRRAERYDDHEEQLRSALDGLRVGMWTSLPCIVESFDPVALTVSAQPAVQIMLIAEDGTLQPTNLPLLPHCPVMFPRGGGCTLTFPIAKGDECLVVFASRSIDGWWQSGKGQPPADLRSHDLSDGFAIIGPFSQRTALTAYSAATTQLRANDGKTFIDLDPAGQIVTVTAPGGAFVNGPLSVRGPITATGDVMGAGVSLQHHVQTNGGGTGNSGPPLPGS